MWKKGHSRMCTHVLGWIGLVKIKTNPLLIVLRKINSIKLNKHVQLEPIQSFNHQVELN